MRRIAQMCLNWKVLVGLLAVGLVIWVVAPGQIRAALPFLILAACPLSMLVMMWGMRRTMQGNECAAPQTKASEPTAPQSTQGNRIAHLRTELSELQKQETVVAREIAALERGSASGTPAVAGGNAGTSPKSQVDGS